MVEWLSVGTLTVSLMSDFSAIHQLFQCLSSVTFSINRLIDKYQTINSTYRCIIVRHTDAWFAIESRHSAAVFDASSVPLDCAVLHRSAAVHSTPRVILRDHHAEHTSQVSYCEIFDILRAVCTENALI